MTSRESFVTAWWADCFINALSFALCIFSRLEPVGKNV